MIPAGIRIGCYFYESVYRVEWEYKLNCGDSCGTEFNKIGYYVIMLRTFMELCIGIISFIWILSPKTLSLWRRLFSFGKDGNMSISTTSTMTTHDFLPNNTYTNDRHAEFHYQYYPSKPLLN